MRRFGLLLHISSLPSACGIGDLGPAAHAFVDLLAASGAKVWQFLPTTPTSVFIGNSPYSSPSAFAGNPLFISPEALAADGLVSSADIDCVNCCAPEALHRPAERVNFAAVSRHREHLLRATFERNAHRLSDNHDFTAFYRRHEHWLLDYTRFVTLKEEHGGAAWFQWPEAYKRRDPKALERWDAHAAVGILREAFTQYLFFRQWESLRRHCRAAGVTLMGDVPIYVTHDSADVWAAPGFYRLDADLTPVTVAGVPPDYFSETGQRWGNPIYNWDALQRDGFTWWKRRIAHNLLLCDVIRLDHFRGFCGYWEIPAEEKTAVNGRWRKAPAEAFLRSLQEHFGSLPLVAEDLGVITDDVRETMRAFALPGMHVLQFAFSGDKPAYNTAIPHLHTPNSVVYTGTHDNPPTRQWFDRLGPDERRALLRYAGKNVEEDEAAALLSRLAFASPADLCVVPIQDALNLGAAARFNTPGLAAGNWEWRLNHLPSRDDLRTLRELAEIYGRLPDEAPDMGLPPDYS